jgi:hypothetical protein
MKDMTIILAFLILGIGAIFTGNLTLQRYCEHQGEKLVVRGLKVGCERQL